MRRVHSALWIRWALRDARHHLLQVLSIALLLALGIGMYAAMSSMSVWRVRSADASFEALRMHDLRVAAIDGATVPEGALASVLRSGATRADVAAAGERLVLPTQVDASRGGRAIIVPGRIVGAEPATAVDTLGIRAGTAPAGARPGLPVTALEYNFARHYALPPTGRLTLAGGRRVSYAGQVLAPEYFIVTAPGADFGAESAFAVVFATLRTAQDLSGRHGRVNQLVLRLRAGADPVTVERRLAAALERALPSTGFTFTRGDQEPAHRLIYKDAEGDQRMLDIFAFLLLGAASFAAFNLVSRTVEAQRREIGIGMALGAEPRALARRPILMGAQIALAGLGLGIPVGLAADAWLAGVMEDFFPLPVLEADFQARAYLEAAGLGLGLCLAATVIPVWRAVRVSPVEAIRVGARSGRTSGLAWLLKDVRVPGGSLANLPLRNVLRTPRRTLMTVLGIGAIVTIVIALSGVMDSFDATLSAGRQEALAGAPGRLTADLVAPRPLDDPGVREVSGAAGVGVTQPSLRLASTLRAGRRHVAVGLEIVPEARPLWHPSLEHGSLPSSGDGLVVARQAARDLRVTVGERVDVVHPVAAGASFRLARTSLPVTGIHTSPFRFVAYANADAARAMGVAGLVSRISLLPTPGHDVDDIERALLRLPHVAAVQGAAATTDAVDQRMEQFNEILAITVVIAGLMALLIAFNATVINADERVREHATMVAYGVPIRRVLGGSVTEGVAVGVLGTAVGVAAGHALLAWIINRNMPETMPDVGMLLTVGPATYAGAVITGIGVVAAAPLLTLRKLRRTDVASALRVVE